MVDGWSCVGSEGVMLGGLGRWCFGELLGRVWAELVVCGAGNSRWKGVGFCGGGSGVLGGVWVDAGRLRNGGGSWVIGRGLGMDLLEFGRLRRGLLLEKECWVFQKEGGGEFRALSRSLSGFFKWQKVVMEKEGLGFISG